VVCEAEAVPEAEAVSWSYRGRELRPGSPLYSILETRLGAVVRSTLVIEQSEEKHFGEYTCSVSNSLGSSSGVLTVKEIGEDRTNSHSSLSPIVSRSHYNFFPHFLSAICKWEYTGRDSRFLLHCKKNVSDIPIPSRDVTNQTLPGWENLSYSRPGRVWFVTSRLGTGKLITFFYSVAFYLAPTPIPSPSAGIKRFYLLLMRRNTQRVVRKGVGVKVRRQYKTWVSFSIFPLRH
jgi:hypothetical protein